MSDKVREKGGLLGADGGQGFVEGGQIRGFEKVDVVLQGAVGGVALFQALPQVSKLTHVPSVTLCYHIYCILNLFL